MNRKAVERREATEEYKAGEEVMEKAAVETHEALERP